MRGNAFGDISVCLSVCLSLCNAVAAASLDLESSFLVCRHIFRIFRSIYQGQRVKVKVTGAKRHRGGLRFAGASAYD